MVVLSRFIRPLIAWANATLIEDAKIRANSNWLNGKPKKQIASDDIAELKRQKLNEEECILNLYKEIEQKSLKAEEKQDLTLLAMANSFRATQKTKAEKVKVLSDTIQKMEDEFRKMK